MKSRYDWEYLPKPNGTLVNDLAQQCQLQPEVVRLLINRGLTEKKTIEKFLNPQVDQLHDPLLLFDMTKAVKRIRQAIAENELIAVYGDYDADGVTSTSLMLETLESLGANVTTYIPDRFQEGYGPHEYAFKKLIDAGVKLIITVDNGVGGKQAITYAQSQQVDVIVTDHHELPPTLPPAYAIIHPRHPKGHYPFGDLSGVGVAFKVASALLEAPASDSFDLTAIGTVCDLVSLTDENRVLVSLGLQQLRQSSRIGIDALCQVAGVKQNNLDEQTIGFVLGPRLNSLGRLGDAKPGIKLLTTFDPDEATDLAKFVQTQNKRRQQYVQEIAATALEMAQTPENQQRQTLVLAHTGWHEGVLGIVASRVVEATGKPTLILTQRDDQTLKGSGRSVTAFHLFKALDHYRQLMTLFGGHHMAVGLSLPQKNLTALMQGLELQAEQVDLQHQKQAALKIDLQLPVTAATSEFLHAYRQLAPFGTDNPAPLFALTPQQVTQVKAIGADHSHLKFNLTDQDAKLAVIAFQMGRYASDLQAAQQVTVVGQLNEHEWRGQRQLQLQLLDFKITGKIIIDQRTVQLHKPLFQHAATYVFFSDKLKRQIQGNLTMQGQAVSANEAFKMTTETLVLVDLPPTLAALKTLLQQHQQEYDKLVTCFYCQQPASLVGMPTRSDFIRLFKFVATHQAINLRKQLTQLADYLNVRQPLLVFMVKVFAELGFIKIADGMMQQVTHPAKANLKSAPSYQQRQQQLLVEQKLIQSDYSTLKQWLHAQVNPNKGAKKNVS